MWGALRAVGLRYQCLTYLASNLQVGFPIELEISLSSDNIWQQLTIGPCGTHLSSTSEFLGNFKPVNFFYWNQMTKYPSKSWSFTPCYTFFNVGHDLVMDLDLDSIFVIKYYLDILKGNSQPINLFLFWLPMCCSILKWYLCGSDVSIIAPAKITKQNYTLGIKNLLLCKGTVWSTCHFTI